jgi:membrane-associated phospholipid phosphatase
MYKKSKQFILSMVIATGCCGNLFAQDIPDAGAFLPGPPEENTVEYIKDYLQYAWGKTMRNTSLGQQAETDFNAQSSYFLNAFSKAIGVTLSSIETPYIAEIFDYCMEYGNKSIQQAKSSFPFFRRPFARFEETSLIPLEESNYVNESSFPSREALMGWMYALLLTEICPDKQNEILQCGYQFGQASVVTGYHWDSDVQAARLLASALTVSLHNHTGVYSMIKSAKAEYAQKTGYSYVSPGLTEETHQYYSDEDLPDAVKYLSAPPDTVSAIEATDISKFIEGKNLRLTDEGQTAIDDVTDKPYYLLEIFSSAFGRTLSETATPQLYELFNNISVMGDGATHSCKNFYMRPRPFRQLNEATAYPPAENIKKNTGSYPSGHASTGWLYALVLSELNPDAEEALLARAYQYGQGRVITGYVWQSDVEAGRLVGSAVYARLHNSEEFLKQMERVRAELNSTGVRAVTATDDASDDIYTLGGVRLATEPTQKGVYIQGNKKVTH